MDNPKNEEVIAMLYERMVMYDCAIHNAIEQQAQTLDELMALLMGDEWVTKHSEKGYEMYKSQRDMALQQAENHHKLKKLFDDTDFEI